MAEMIYLAAPYSGTKAQIEQRMQEFCRIDAALMKDGYFTVSPLLKHFTLPYANLPGTIEFWEEYSQELMKRCDALIIIKLDGWQESSGIAIEIRIAERLRMPIIYFDPVTKIFE